MKQVIERIGWLFLLGLLCVACTTSPTQAGDAAAELPTNANSEVVIEHAATATVTERPTATATETPMPSATPILATPFAGSNMQRLAYLVEQQDKYEVYVAEWVDGQIGAPEQITHQPEVMVYYDVDWSMDGNSLYYVGSDKKVYQHFLETAEITNLYDVVYNAPNTLSVHPLTGQLALEITHNYASTANCRPGIPATCVLANVTLEQFQYECRRASKANYDIWCYDPAVLCQVNDNDDCSPLLPEEEYDLMQPSWSPDGSKMAYVSNREGTQAIYLLDAQGNSQRITKRPSVSYRSISWSPDGQKLLFSYQPGEEKASREICTVNADGSDFSCITRNEIQDDSPAWSPDGQWMVYTSQVDAYQQLFLMKVEDESITQLTEDLVNHYRPVWSP